MKKSIFTLVIIMMASFSFAQEKEDLKALKKANNYVYEGNELLADKEDFVSAEMEYRKAISEQSNTVAGIYNLGNAYYKSKNYNEALYRLQEAAKVATTKAEKHRAFHNIGNILMENKKCKEAVEAYKNALRNNPTDDETRYNLGLAKICAEQQNDGSDGDDGDKKDDENKDKKDQNQGQNKDNQDQNKENQENQDKQEGDDQKDEEGEPKDEKEDQNKGNGEENKKEQQQPKPQPGQLSPQQIKNILEAMNNQEQKVQEKVNAEKQKGVKVQTDKDW
ncbi:tetratricopeptide repeat protein [Flavobacteriaceae bacterium XHP0103]|uniref:tetratricopeptide repeat protein n=1 Tax=Marixanthotalea marina TaxID=2844359 RepID=UPI002989F711|nr:tetratricopeptide repeat protein [Marixanthotalea marina]MBU3820486.1 tetratricopeptide repeat protein [Marixanthotalea marina]